MPESAKSDILIVDDEADIRELIADILQDEGHSTRTAHDADSAMAHMNTSAPALMILDIWLKDSRMDGIEILKTVKRDNPDVPVIIISGHGNVEIAVAAVKQGAYDFIEKPFNIDKLLMTVNRALEASRLRRENTSLRGKSVQVSDLIGGGAAIRTLRQQLDRVARSNGRVLLSGPPGSGKDVAAHYLHRQSERADRPFVTVSSASIAPDRMEEVLFGVQHEARAHVPGLFEQAHGGTLFFDEVADMPLGTQSKILRVLVDQAFTRINGSETVRVDVRVISATNKNLTLEIEQGRFRQDLFHRLNVVPLDVPGLDSRREDIPTLVEHFVTQLNGEQGLPVRTLSEDAAAVLQTLPWPGHVRQLRNLIERILILGPDSGEIQACELPQDKDGAETDGRDALSAALAGLPLREAREVFEREYLIAQINRFSGNISRTASFVGMERSALHRKLKSLNIVTMSRGGTRMASIDEVEDDE
ncbi:two-component system, NtrC family, nitrogen regulation response regulator NtrX [Monaibacterium marinum]|uniref:Nif-specific regulatory protein n=1 Tax=Pontivivens marinum TaxID=1690039 RepID=A0A2C9CTH0_9RHOB|nr:sigma-54 dependent transcriptional regulator [Monaibacterium marinum]SOH93679.1 two-component system, NtrC family, nitrogen regulation response regulator NtrX [Monaibacterium marinum]